jgi:hypothetical protein
MQLGKSLLGAIIGAALSIGLLLVVFLVFHLDAFWLAIPVAIITGLAVRMIAATKGHASYLRGAITAIVALAAYMGGMVLAGVVANQTAKKAKEPAASAKADAGEGAVADADKTATEPGAEAPAPPAAGPKPATRPAGAPQMQKLAVPGQNPLDYVWLAIAALVAYELGRGSGMAPRETAPSEPVPAGTHPDA